MQNPITPVRRTPAGTVEKRPPTVQRAIPDTTAPTKRPMQKAINLRFRCVDRRQTDVARIPPLFSVQTDPDNDRPAAVPTPMAAAHDAPANAARAETIEITRPRPNGARLTRT